MTDHSAPTAVAALRDELRAFVEQWAAVARPYDPSECEIPAQVWERGRAALKVASHDRRAADEEQSAAAHAPALREWIKREWPPLLSAAADQMDDLALWRKANSWPGRWFGQLDAENREFVAGQAAGLFLNVFAPLASKIVKAIGRESWPDEPPDPPVIPGEIRPDNLGAELFGVASNNTLAAGKLCLLWGAMAHDPKAFHRPNAWPSRISAWAHYLIVPIESGNGYRAMMQPIGWALEAFDRFVFEQNAKLNASDRSPAEVQDGNALETAPSGFLGGTELADALGVHLSRRDAFFVQLQRKRIHLGDDSWIQIADKGPNRPEFLYRADLPALRILATKYRDEKSA